MAARRRPYTQSTDAGGRWTYDGARGLDRWTCAADQWQGVLGKVSEALLAGADLDTALREYNEAASDYRALIFHYRARIAKGPPVKAWRARREHLEAALQGITRLNHPLYWLQVSRALHFANAAIVACEMEGRTHHGRKSPERNWLYSRLLKIWTKRFKEELTTGRSKSAGGKRGANSPAIRFLLAALAPILDADDMIKAEAAEKIVEAEIKRRAQMPEMVASWKAGLKAMKRRARRQRAR
jgi:hypothetical protein